MTGSAAHLQFLSDCFCDTGIPALKQTDWDRLDITTKSVFELKFAKENIIRNLSIHITNITIIYLFVMVYGMI